MVPLYSAESDRRCDVNEAMRHAVSYAVKHLAADELPEWPQQHNVESWSASACDL